MKKFLFSVMALGLALTANAQNTEKQMATLQHGEQTLVFYGTDAFRDAYNAAADTLDVITLSSGTFSAPGNISKSIAVYGAGFEKDEATGIEPTRLNGELYLVPADGVNEDGYTVKAEKKVNGVHIEGLYFDNALYFNDNDGTPIHNLTMAKCYCPYLYFSVDSYDCVVRQSIIGGFYSAGNPNIANNLLLTNCYCFNNYGYLNLGTFDRSSTILVDHCILPSSGISGPFRYTNNIMYFGTTSGAIYSNNVFVGNDTTAQDDNGNWKGVTNAALWSAEGEDGSYEASRTFELKYPGRYVGTDGTQIGLHGGTYAWNKIPAIPRITEYEIDTHDVENGKLKVSIKAEAQKKE